MRYTVSQKEPKNYEQAVARLEQIALLLEKGGQGIDESMALFEESVGLSAYCYKKLDEIKSRITFLKDKSEIEEGEQEDV